MIKSILTSTFIMLLATFSYGQIAEAEDGTLGGTEKATSRAGYSGSGYVTGFDNSGDEVSVQLLVTAKGTYELWIRYAAPDRKTNKVIVNGETKDMEFPKSETFREGLMGKVRLNEGTNTIKIVHSWGYFDVDYVRASRTNATEINHYSETLVNSNASKEAKVLYQYLKDAYGKRIISGQQNESNYTETPEKEIEYILEKTGKQPAIRGFDFIDYSPSRVVHGTNPVETEKIIAWHNKGGIVAAAWHWNAPKDLIDETGKEWWRGFYTEATTFDLTIAMNDENSEEYELLVGDMDSIAVQLKKLKVLNIPVLWRPLHEAEGGWFWWGAKGSGALKWLWKLLYDRYVKHHELNNLIWVWTSADGESAIDWYPGDEYVDIIGADIYLNQQDYSANYTYFDNLASVFEGKKLITLTETGIIPDPERLLDQKAKWNWFCTWSGNFILDPSYNSVSHISGVYNHEYVITLDELPDFSNYTDPQYNDPFESDEFYEQVTGISDTAGRFNVYPNPVQDKLIFSYEEGFQIWGLSVQDGTGRRLVSYNKEEIFPEMEIDFSNMNSGVYYLKVISEGDTSTYKLMKK